MRLQTSIRTECLYVTLTNGDAELPSLLWANRYRQMDAALEEGTEVILEGRFFGYPTEEGYRDTDGEFMSKQDAVADQALLMIGTTVAGYLVGPSLLDLVEANPILGILAAGFVIYLALHKEIEQWKLA